MNVYSSSGIAGSLRPDCCPGYGYVDRRRTSDLRDYYKLYNVFPGGARLLESGIACIDKERAFAPDTTTGHYVCECMVLALVETRAIFKTYFERH